MTLHFGCSHLSCSCLHLLILGWQISRRRVSSGRPKVISDNGLDVDDDLLWSGEGHHEVLLVDVAPAGEEAVGGQEEEQVLPLQPQVVLVEHLQNHQMKDYSVKLHADRYKQNKKISTAVKCE